MIYICKFCLEPGQSTNEEMKPEKRAKEEEQEKSRTEGRGREEKETWSKFKQMLH